MLTLTVSTKYRRTKAIKSFYFGDGGHSKNVIFEKMFPIFKSNTPPEDDVSKKWKIGTVELIFHEASKNVVVFYAASWEKTALNNLLSKSQKQFGIFKMFIFGYLKKGYWVQSFLKIFYFSPWYLGKECIPILMTSLVDSYLGTM